MDTLSLSKEARIYNGGKTISLTSGAGKIGQTLVKEWTRSLSNTAHKNKKTELEESDYTIKLQYSKQYDTGTKRETYRSMARIENQK